MKVTLRERNQGGKTSFYLDYYHRGKRKTEYLKLYLQPDAKTKEEKEVNRKTLQLAETIRAQRQIEIQNGVYGFEDFFPILTNGLTKVKELFERLELAPRLSTAILVMC